MKISIGFISTDTATTAAWAAQEGFQDILIIGPLVRATADHAVVSRALGITWNTLTATDWHTTATPTLPPHVASVSGLSTQARLAHYHVMTPEAAIPPIVTPGPIPGYTPAQILAAYGIDQPWDGTGETLAIAEWSNDFVQSDIDTFCQTFNLPACTPEVVNIGGYTPSSTPGVEATLDIEWAHAIAPGAQIRMYNANAGTSYSSFALEVTTLLATIAAESAPPHILSISYGDAESNFTAQDLQSWELLMTTLGNKGVTVLVAAGDQGAYGQQSPGWPQQRNACAPASCVHALAVGGTSLFMNLETLNDEFAWTNVYNTGATGGGFSAYFKAPTYQATSGMRSVPDLAAVADPWTPCALYWNGTWNLVGGTSLATPVVAGLLTRVNHARRLAGFHPLGYVTPVLYELQALKLGLFRDITTGNNTCFSVAGYEAQVGFDQVTGLGAPIAQMWFDQLAWGAPKPA